ncbi:MAG: HAD family phosphatase [Lachnospiraceae bacterium]|nr:HAD family phosphatase [Lachnospiraceae bacterium]
MNNRKILILDIDGTLVNSKKEITPETLKYLLKIQEQGHIVALASGRPYPGMKAFAKQLKLQEYGGYVLSFNGGKVISCKTEEVVFQKAIPNSYLKTIYDYAISNQLGMVTYKGDEVLTGTEIDGYMEYEARLNSMVIHKVDDFLDAVDFDMTKCLLTAEPAKAEVCEKELAELLSPGLNVFRSEPYFIEITTKGVDKAESVDKLVKAIGMKQEDTICCGDGFNDLTMVQYAGVGVAMGNAQQVVKDNADYITASCDEDGIVQVIKEFIL